MQTVVDLYERLVEEVPFQEQQFPPIGEKLEVLDKYKVEVPEEIRRLHAIIPEEWAAYKEVLEEAEKMIELSKVLYCNPFP